LVVLKLIEKRLASIENPREQVRATRVLQDLVKIFAEDREPPAPNIRVDQVTTADILLYVNKRRKDGLLAQSINRELNIIAATLNAAQTFYPQLAQWITPKMPRPKASKARRERIYTKAEKTSLLGYLLAPRKDGEQYQAYKARRRVGLQYQFAFLTGMRHGELDNVRKEHVDFEAKSMKVFGHKTQFVSNPTRYIQPQTETMLAILHEFYDASETDYVFSRSGNTIPSFYRISREAHSACGIPYGRKIPGGATFHDTRHTATTRMLQGGADLSTIQTFTGHSDETMVLYYSHSTPESRSKASAILEEYAGDAPFPSQAALSQEMLDILFQMFRVGKISQDRLAEILKNGQVPDELLGGGNR
jgi:integrase